jgi:hypothetical protein
MTSRRVLPLLVCGVLIAGASVVAPASAAASRSPAASAVEVALDRASVATRLGEGFGFGSTITNTGRTPLAGLVAHLNVLGLTDGVYVDPEDWSPDRTKAVPALAPGESADVGWTVTAVNGGRFAVYVVVVPRDAPRTESSGLAIGRPMALRVAERRTLNSGGVLFLVVGVPALLGLGALAMRSRRRFGRPRAAGPRSA